MLRTSRVESHSAIELTLTGANAPVITHYLATAEIEHNGITYINSLRKVGAHKQSITRAVDRCDVFVENVSAILGPDWINNVDEIYGASIKVKRYYRSIDTGQTFLLQTMSGIVRSAKASQDSVTLSCIADTYAKFIGGGRRVALKCQFRYADPLTCAHDGSFITCNKLYSHADGCLGRSNQHHYGGMINIQPKDSVSGAAGLALPPANQVIRNEDTGSAYVQQSSLAFAGATITNVAAENKTLVDFTGGASSALNWINVKTDHGAIGDGVADDTAAVQAAITSAQTGPKGVVYFPPGIYKVTGLTCAGRVVLLGSGQAVSVIYSTSNATILTMSGDASFRGGYIEKLTIRGSITAGSSQIGLRQHDGTYQYGVVTRDVRIEDCGDHGLSIGNTFSSLWENVFITNCVDYPFLYDAANMPTNVFRSVYVGDLRSTGVVAFRIKAGEFIGYDCNGVNSTGSTSSKWMVLGKKNGVDGDGTDASARAHLYNCNLESWSSHAILCYYGSPIFIYGKSTIAGNAVAGQKGIEHDLVGDGTAYFAQFIQRGYIEDSVDFADGAAAYANSEPIHANGFCPIEICGTGIGSGGGQQLVTYRNNSSSVVQRLPRKDGRFKRVAISSTTSIPQQGTNYYELNSAGAAFTLTLDWPGWYEREQHPIYIKDAGGAAATNNITIQVNGGGTINGASSFTMNVNKQALILIPDGDTGAGDWRIIGQYPASGALIDGTGASPRLAYFSDADTLTTTSGLEYDSGNTALKSPGKMWVADRFGWSGDTNTYMGNPGSDEIDWYTGGSQKMWLTAGNLNLAVNLRALTDNAYDLSLAGNRFRDADFSGVFGGPRTTGSGSGAQTLDWVHTNQREFTMTGNVTFTFSNGLAGKIYTLITIQDATGSRTISWPAAIDWPGGAAGVPTSAANAKDIWQFYYDGTNYLNFTQAYQVS